MKWRLEEQIDCMVIVTGALTKTEQPGALARRSSAAPGGYSLLDVEFLPGRFPFRLKLSDFAVV